jgi:hypothetical protein
VSRGLKIAAISILIFLGIVITYTAGCVVVPRARLTVDGRPALGWLHRANRRETLFLTRRDGGKAESYFIYISGDSKAIVSGCGPWTVTRVPAFPAGDLNPPCETVVANEGTTRIPSLLGRNFAAGSNFVEFTADEGSRVKATGEPYNRQPSNGRQSNGSAKYTTNDIL